MVKKNYHRLPFIFYHRTEKITTDSAYVSVAFLGLVLVILPQISLLRSGKKMWKMGNVMLIFKDNIKSDDMINAAENLEDNENAFPPHISRGK